MKYNYFEVPTQVKFWDEITHGCCGGIFSIGDIYEVAPDALDDDPIIVVDGWRPINYNICGKDN